MQIKINNSKENGQTIIIEIEPGDKVEIRNKQSEPVSVPKVPNGNINFDNIIPVTTIISALGERSEIAGVNIKNDPLTTKDVWFDKF